MAILEMTTERFDREVLEAGHPVIVEFSAPWCGYCRRLNPVLERMDGQPGIPQIVKVDIDEQPKLAERFGIEVIPTLLLFRNGAHGEAIVAPGSQPQVETWIRSQMN